MKDFPWRDYVNFFFFFLGFIWTIQVFLESLFSGSILLTVCASIENRLSLHLLGSSGKKKRFLKLSEIIKYLKYSFKSGDG